MSSGGLCSTDLRAVTEAEERQIREAYDQVAVTSHRARLGKSLHLATENDKECDHRLSDMVHKSFEVYPIGYRRICRECAEHWRQSNTAAMTDQSSDGKRA